MKKVNPNFIGAALCMAGNFLLIVGAALWSTTFRHWDWVSRIPEFWGAIAATAAGILVLLFSGGIAHFAHKDAIESERNETG